MNGAAPSSHLDDIAWNRAGRLSAAQRATLQEVLSIHPNEMMAWLFSTTLVGVAALIVVQEDGSQSRFHWGMCALMAAGGLAAAWMPLRRIWLRARLRADIAAGDVAMFPGRVVWRVRRLHGDYVMEPADGSAPVRAAAAPLPPGPYRGYLLPRSRLLIAAESTVVPGGAWSISLGIPDVEGGVFAGRPGRTALAQPFSMAPHVGDRIELFRALASALRFNAEDLGHNRRGRISLRQVGHRLTSSAGFLAMTLCVAASGVLFAFFAEFNDDSTFISPIVVVAALHYLWSIRDVFTRRVVTVEGIVKRHLWVTPGSNASDQSRYTYYFVVQHQKFVVKKRAYRALVPELPYRLYFTKHTRALLSVDPLDTSSTHPRGAPRAGAAWEAT